MPAQVKAAPGSVQEPYLTADTTSGGARYAQAGDQFAIWAGGQDLSGWKDEKGVIYRDDAAGEKATVQARLVSQNSASPVGKAGIALANDLTAPEKGGYAVLAMTESYGLEFMTDSDGDGKLDTWAGGGSTYHPAYLKLTRDGATYTAYSSKDGETWSQVGTAQVPSAAGTGDAGMVASAANVELPRRGHRSRLQRILRHLLTRRYHRHHRHPPLPGRPATPRGACRGRATPRTAVREGTHPWHVRPQLVAAFVAGVVVAASTTAIAVTGTRPPSTDLNSKATTTWLTVKVADAMGTRDTITWVPTGSFAGSAEERVPRYPMTAIQGKDTKELSLSAVRNEQVSAQLAIASGQDLDDVKAVVGDLTGPGGAKLSGDDTQVRFVKYVPVQRSKSEVDWSATIDQVSSGKEVSGDRNPDVVGDALEERSSVDVPAYAAQPLWFTFQHPRQGRARHLLAAR